MKIFKHKNYNHYYPVERNVLPETATQREPCELEDYNLKTKKQDKTEENNTTTRGDAGNGNALLKNLESHLLRGGGKFSEFF